MPSEFTLYHNPRCSKSRAALALLEEKGVAADVVKYLDTAPDLATLQDMFAKLGIESVRGMMRTKDDLYKELGFGQSRFGQCRPASGNRRTPCPARASRLVTPTRAAIGRPLENIAALLG